MEADALGGNLDGYPAVRSSYVPHSLSMRPDVAPASLGAKARRLWRTTNRLPWCSSTPRTPTQREANAGGRLLVEATENGWWYFAPLALGSCVATYMTDADMLPHGGKRALREWWIDQVRSTEHVKAKVIDRRDSESGLLVRWARSQCLSAASGKGWLAVGDAAYAFDPLASQGIAKALEGARQSAEVVLRCLSGGENLLREHAQRVIEAYNGVPSDTQRLLSVGNALAISTVLASSTAHRVITCGWRISSVTQFARGGQSCSHQQRWVPFATCATSSSSRSTSS